MSADIIIIIIKKDVTYCNPDPSSNPNPEVRKTFIIA